jgi:CheY-like chemotaxis protein
MNKRKKKILVADDDPGILDALQIMLEDNDYDVAVTIDGQSIYKMEKDFPDLLLLDIWMSGLDGREICRYLKKSELTRSIPIIMISANRDTEKIAKEAGADDFLAKPFEMEILLKKIAKYISKS